jgi:hypothetical protein
MVVSWYKALTVKNLRRGRRAGIGVSPYAATLYVHLANAVPIG